MNKYRRAAVTAIVFWGSLTGCASTGAIGPVADCKKSLGPGPHKVIASQRIANPVDLRSLLEKVDRDDGKASFSGAPSLYRVERSPQPITLLLFDEGADSVALCAVDVCTPRIAWFKRSVTNIGERWVVDRTVNWKEQVCGVR
jgi:hypothetical protein